MSRKFLNQCSVALVPQFNTLVATGTRNRSRVATKSHRVHGAVPVTVRRTKIAIKFANHRLFIQLPLNDFSVKTAANQYSPVWADCHSINRCGMAEKSMDEFTCLQVPQLNCFIIASASENMAVRINNNSMNRGTMAVDNALAPPVIRRQ